MKKIKVCWLLSVCLLLRLSCPSFLIAEETTVTFATELTGDALYEQGLNLSNQEKYQSAIPCFEEAVKRKSNFVDAYYQLGICYIQVKQFEKAKQNLILAKVLAQNQNLKEKINILVAKIPEEIEREKKRIEEEKWKQEQERIKPEQDRIEREQEAENQKRKQRTQERLKKR